MNRAFLEMENCRVCPQNCGIDRYSHRGICGAGSELKIDLAHLHHGEEPVISGTRGSGTIFFSHCNLHCLFCQNHSISQLGWGSPQTIEQCAQMMLDLQEAGAHNLNLVSPTHFTPQIRAAIQNAKAQGLNIPIVWNSNAYESVDSLNSLDGLVDTYLPDFKYAHSIYSKKYSGADDYPTHALAALKEMHRQCGHLTLNAEGIAQKGLLVRHLVLPHRISGSRGVLRLLHDNFGSELALSLMSQYYPTAAALGRKELNRCITPDEYHEVLDTALELGFTRVYIQELAPGAEWTPDFQPEAVPLDNSQLHFTGKNTHAQN